jgi:tetratricopeptide (TPR) repeat protein
VQTRLEKDGVFCQWVQLYELTPETFASLVASFLEVFPNGQAFCVWSSVDLLLVAMPDTRTLALDRLERSAVQRYLDRAKIARARDLAGFWSGPLSDFIALSKSAELNRDDRPVVEYRAPRDLIAMGKAALTGDQRYRTLVPCVARRPEGPLFASWPGESWYEDRAMLLSRSGEDARAATIVEGARSAGFAGLAARLAGDVDSARRRRHALEAVAEARNLLALGQEEQGRRLLASAGETDSTYGIGWVMLADRFREAGDFERAVVTLQRARAASREPDVMTDASMVGGILEFQRQNYPVAIGLFREAQRWNPVLAQSYLLEAQSHSAAGDVAAAREAIRRGLAAVPGDPGLSAAAQQLAGS